MWNTLHWEKWTQDRHDLYIFHTLLSSAAWRPDMGLKAEARMKSISETWVIEAPELVLAKAVREPEAGLKEQLQSCYLYDRIRTQWKLKQKMFIPELKRHPGYCLKGHLNIQFALLATGPMMQGRGRLSGWSNVLCIWCHGSGGLQRAILKITVESRHIAVSSDVVIVCSFLQQGPTKHLHGPHSKVGRHNESIPWLHHY